MNTETAPNITHYDLKNPLELRNQQTALKAKAGDLIVERNTWMDAVMRKHLPGWMYRATKQAFSLIESPNASETAVERAHKEYGRLMEKMKSEGWEFTHNGLITSLFFKGVEIERFEIRLKEGVGS